MIKKSEVVKALDEQQTARYAYMCKLLDERLSAYDGKHGISIDVLGDSEKVISMIMDAYGTHGGWTVTRNKGSDQRDGSWDTLVFS